MEIQKKRTFPPNFGHKRSKEVGPRRSSVIDGREPTETAPRAAKMQKKRRLNPLSDRCHSAEVMSGCVGECSGPAHMTALEEMAKIMVQNAREPAVGKESKAMVVLREFKKHNPPVFRGCPDPKLAEHWLSRMEKILNFMSITDDQTRVSLAASRLEKDALQWWCLIDRTLTWQEFRDLFIDKYFPLIFRHALEHDFLQLIQRGISVMEYEAEFTELARYAHELVPDEETRIRRFIRGLKVALRNRVSLLDLHSYSEAVHRTLALEDELGNRQGFHRERPQRDPDERSCFNCGEQGHYKNCCPHPHNKNGCPQREARALAVEELDNGKNFQRERPQRDPDERICFNCGEQGHYKNCCPYNKNGFPQREAMTSPGSTRQKTCYRCGEPGHIRHNCGAITKL